MNDPAIRWGKDDVLKVWDFSPRVPEKISDEQRQKYSKKYPDLPSHDSDDNS
jgi:hypothetical protein